MRFYQDPISYYMFEEKPRRILERPSPYQNNKMIYFRQLNFTAEPLSWSGEDVSNIENATKYTQDQAYVIAQYLERTKGIHYRVVQI